MIKQATDILDRLTGDDEELRLKIFIERICAKIATEIYEARTREKLTQTALARLVGTSQSAIARLEDADYDGHSVKTLARIAMALGLDVSVSFHSHSDSVSQWISPPVTELSAGILFARTAREGYGQKKYISEAPIGSSGAGWFANSSQEVSRSRAVG